jgi:CRP-like cAMP-binding protein
MENYHKRRINCLDCSCLKCYIHRFCSDTEQVKVSENKDLNYYRSGDSIFKEGNTMLGIYFVMHGAIKVVTSGPNGREQVVRLASDGDLLGHRVLGNDKYYFNAIALKDTQICFMETAAFKDTCMSSPEFSYRLLLFYALELRRTELRVKYHAQMNIREKVAQAFVYLNEVFDIDPQTKKLNVDLSRKEIADIAGTTPEQVTRQLSDFEEEKLISRTKRDIQIVNAEGLESIVRDYKIS